MCEKKIELKFIEWKLYKWPSLFPTRTYVYLSYLTHVMYRMVIFLTAGDLQASTQTATKE